ncbi:MAG: protease inhibitor I42 family protein [Bacilli bacterium]|nr:protease inhibitor I42 family protein [Bacilli bacterium]
MKKKLLLIFFVLLLIVILIFLITNKKAASITLKTNSGVPYSWIYEIENPKIVKFKAKKVKAKNKNLAGGEVTETYIFKGTKKGTTIITFKYKSVSSNRVEKKVKYKATVDKKLNLKLEEKKF